MWKLLTGAIGDVFKSWQRGRIRKWELEDAKHARRVTVIQEGRVNEATWNQKAIENAGWRDDWLTLLFSVPMILAFFPQAVEPVLAGFAALQTMPAWYQGAVSLMIASAFGYQKYHHWQMSKNYSLASPDEELEKKV